EMSRRSTVDGRQLAVGLLAMLAPMSAWGASPDHAYGLVEEQRIDEAAKEIEPLVKARPHDPEVAFVDGDLLLHRGEYARAAERYGEAMKLRGRVGEEARRM